jgi:hypothetical protein
MPKKYGWLRCFNEGAKDAKEYGGRLTFGQALDLRPDKKRIDHQVYQAGFLINSKGVKSSRRW